MHQLSFSAFAAAQQAPRQQVRLVLQHTTYVMEVHDWYTERLEDGDRYRHGMDAPDRLPMGGAWCMADSADDVARVHGWVMREGR